MGKKKKRQEPETLNLPPVGIDSHAHMDLEDFDEDRDELLDRARACGVSAVGNVFLGPDAYEKNRGMFDGRDDVFFLLGVHPNESQTCTPEAVDRMRAMFRADSRLKAVGEIGLDYYWKRVPNEVQHDAFRRQLTLARELGLPPVIHSRDAEDDTIAILDDEGFAGAPVLWHCFGLGPEKAQAMLDRGWTLSVPGPVTYRKNDDLIEAVKVIPLDCMVIETDCPFLTPEPWRGKRNHPALVGFAAAKIAEIKGLEPEDVWLQTGDTARRFFGLEEK